MEGNQLWVQKVSSTPCTRADVLHLEELLNTKLQQRQAKETGICPVRRELYSQCFGKEEAEMLPIIEGRINTHKYNKSHKFFCHSFSFEMNYSDR